MHSKAPEPLYANPQRAQLKQLAASLRRGQYRTTDAQLTAQRRQTKLDCGVFVVPSVLQDARSFLVARGCARHSAFLYCILILIVRNPSACLLDVWHGGFLPRAWRVMLFRCCGWRATCGRASALRRSSPAACVKKKKSSADFAGMLLFRRLHGRVAFVIYDQYGQGGKNSQYSPANAWNRPE